MKKELKKLVVMRVINLSNGLENSLVIEKRNPFLMPFIKDGQLIPTDKAAKMLGITVRYLRRLCSAQKVDVEQILGRYYFTPEQIAKLQKPIRRSRISPLKPKEKSK
jgi:hypothetical protein